MNHCSACGNDFGKYRNPGQCPVCGASLSVSGEGGDGDEDAALSEMLSGEGATRSPDAPEGDGGEDRPPEELLQWTRDILEKAQSEQRRATVMILEQTVGERERFASLEHAARAMRALHTMAANVVIGRGGFVVKLMGDSVDCDA